MTVDIDLSPQVVIVTGATGGLGQEMTRRFAQAGARVVVHHRSSVDAARSLADEVAGVAVSANLTETGAAQRLVDEALSHFGRIDGLINNAAIQPLANLSEVDEAAWSAMLDTNLSAAHRLAASAAGVMADGGWITHIASIEGLSPAPGHGHYAVSKAGLIMHAKAAALEWGTRGIRVNSISPGLIDRPGLAEAWPDGVGRWHAAAPLERLGQPRDVADACLFLASDLASWITGTNLIVDGGVSSRPSW